MTNRILLVDDEQKIVEVLARFLRRNNYEVIEAIGGRQALKILSSGEKPDLAVVDLKMPEINGIEVLREALKKNIKAVIFTASLNIVTFRDQLIELGYNIDDVVHKPIDLKTFLSVIEKRLSA